MTAPAKHVVGDDRLKLHRLREKHFEALEQRITEAWGHVNAATYRFPYLLAEFDRNEGWARNGLVNCAQWLNWQCGIATGTAREKVRTARALENLPLISEAFRLGQISGLLARHRRDDLAARPREARGGGRLISRKIAAIEAKNLGGYDPACRPWRGLAEELVKHRDAGRYTSRTSRPLRRTRFR